MTLEEFFWPKNTLLRALIFCIDLASLVFIGYWPYVIVWTYQHHGLSYNDIPAVQRELDDADILPCVFGIFWFSTQYAVLYLKYGATWKARFPRITQLVTSKALKWTMIIAPTLLVLIAAHLRTKARLGGATP